MYKRVLSRSMTNGQNQLYDFGPFRVDAEERVLFRDGEVVSLPPKTFDTLLALVRNSGRALDKNALMKEIWPDTFVEEANLAQQISLLRKSLGEDAGGRRYIETIPRRGYRFLSKVETKPKPDEQSAEVGEPQAPTEQDEAPPRAQRRSRVA